MSWLVVTNHYYWTSFCSELHHNQTVCTQMVTFSSLWHVNHAFCLGENDTSSLWRKHTNWNEGEDEISDESHHWLYGWSSHVEGPWGKWRGVGVNTKVSQSKGKGWTVSFNNRAATTLQWYWIITWKGEVQHAQPTDPKRLFCTVSKEPSKCHDATWRF